LYSKNHKKTAVQAGLLSAFRLMAIQSIVVVLISAMWGLHSFDALSSALLGGVVAIVPNVYFAYRFFASGRHADPKKIVRTFYTGELLKLVITIVLAIGIFMLLPILLLPFLTGLVGATLGLWSAPKVVAS